MRVPSGCLLLLTAVCAATGQQEERVQMFKVLNGECAQTTLPEHLKKGAVSFAGLQPGSCADQGFTVAKGKKAITVPLMGNVTLELYRQVDMLGVVADMGAQALGLQGPSACCRQCEAPRIRHMSVHKDLGECREFCLTPGPFSAFSLMLSASSEPALTTAGEEGCAGLGFIAFNHTRTLLGNSADIYTLATPGLVTVSKVVGGVCAQAIIDEKSETQVSKAAGLVRGDCVVRGYSQAAGTKGLEVPMIGAVSLSLYRKEGELDVVDALRVSLTLLADEDVTLYKIGDGMCGEATLDKKYEGPAKMFAGLQEGKCKDHGYSKPAGSKDIDVPVLGDIKISFFGPGAGTAPVLI